MKLDPEFSEDFAHPEGASPQTLSEWTAEDFSLIYVRFRPHLVSHARKLLNNEFIAEEAVQDAFLYLMTALPELDSEVGVLRFLKWKTRMLCLDILRAQGANPTLKAARFEDELVSEEPNVSENLERADDAAIVRLALALLPQRHRQAIVATVFEEKTHSEVAREMGLSDNGFRQLLHRARKSFRTALTGQAETQGMTVSEALRLASRRHRSKIAAASSFAILLLALATPNLNQSPQFPVAEIASDVPLKNQPGLRDATPDIPLETGSVQVSDSRFELPANQVAAVLEDSGQSPSPANRGFASEVLPDSEEEANETENEELVMLRLMLAEEIRDFPLSRLQALRRIESSSSTDAQVKRFEFSEHATLVAQIANCPDGSGLPCGIYVEDTRKGQNLIWFARTVGIVEEQQALGPNRTYELVATDFIVGDFGGQYGNAAVDTPPGGPSGYLKARLSLDGYSVLSLEKVEFVTGS